MRDMLKEIHRLGLEATSSIQERRRVRNLLRKRVKRLISTYGENPVLNHFLTVKLRNAERDLFLYVVDSACCLYKQCRREGTARARGSQKGARIHPVRGDDEMVGESVYLHHDLEGPATWTSMRNWQNTSSVFVLTPSAQTR